MKSKILIFILGIAVGISLVLFIKNKINKKEYVILNSTYSCSNGSLIKEGTKLCYDSAFSEGFSQYIMYINIEEQDKRLEKVEPPPKYSIIPYWFEPVE